MPSDDRLDHGERLVGTWDIEATHPGLPGALIGGRVTFEWLDGRKFLIQRAHFDHPEIPDAIMITGVTGGRLSMHYFDFRGVYRLFAVDLDEHQWRFWGDVGEFHQRFTGTFDAEGNTIEGLVELSYDEGATWADDLVITYRRR